MNIFEKAKSILSSDNEEKEEEYIEETKGEQTPFYKRPSVWGVTLGTIVALKFLFGGEKRLTVPSSKMLTKNFRVGEFLKSASIPELKEYQLTERQLGNLNRLATVLQSFRDNIGVPVYINSGGRPPELRATRGEYKGMTFVEILKAKNYSPSEFSQHMDFSAADFTCGDKRNLLIVMESMMNVYFQSAMGKSITQVIIYIENGVPDFIHLGVHSDINNFENIIGKHNRMLIAIVNRSENGKRSTKFVPFSIARMHQELRVE